MVIRKTDETRHMHVNIHITFNRIFLRYSMFEVSSSLFWFLSILLISSFNIFACSVNLITVASLSLSNWNRSNKLELSFHLALSSECFLYRNSYYYIEIMVNEISVSPSLVNLPHCTKGLGWFFFQTWSLIIPWALVTSWNLLTQQGCKTYQN